MPDGPIDLRKHPLHLGLGATIEVEPEHTGDFQWYMDYGMRHAADGAEGRLVAIHHFNGAWPTWEMHPQGHEVVVLLSGRMVLHQKDSWDGEVRTVVLDTPHQAVVNQPGVWHTADIEDTAVALFITAGLGTENRGR